MVCVLLAACLQAASSTASDSRATGSKPLGPRAEISLLTCAPGKAIWTHYGHSAIRVNDPDNGRDLCFNYGLFNFNSPNFAGRFISGQTDYLLGACPTALFIEDYRSERRSIHEQVLNLSPTEKEALWQALCENAKRENRQYRYNFFYDNCATRARNIIENNIEGKVSYDSTLLYPTLRASLKHYTAAHPWADFGISFLIASEADKAATFSELLYAPGEMQIAFGTAHIAQGDSLRPMVKSSGDIIFFPGSFTDSSLQAKAPKNKPFDMVFWTMAAIFACCVFLQAIERKAHKKYTLIDIVLYALAGLAGCLLCYLAIWSEHPAVHKNLLILWLNPLHLLYAIGLCIPAFRKSRASVVYPCFAAALCALMMLLSLMLPQNIHPAYWPLIAIYLLRAIPVKK